MLTQAINLVGKEIFLSTLKITVIGLVMCILVGHMPGKVKTMVSSIDNYFILLDITRLLQDSKMTEASIMVLEL